jgi:hypothetical protein
LILNVSKVAAISPTGAPALGHFRPVGATAQFPSERPFIKSINGQPYSGAKGEPLREVAQI